MTLSNSFLQSGTQWFVWPLCPAGGHPLPERARALADPPLARAIVCPPPSPTLGLCRSWLSHVSILTVASLQHKCPLMCSTGSQCADVTRPLSQKSWPQILVSSPLFFLGLESLICKISALDLLLKVFSNIRIPLFILNKKEKLTKSIINGLYLASWVGLPRLHTNNLTAEAYVTQSFFPGLSQLY